MDILYVYEGSKNLITAKAEQVLRNPPPDAEYPCPKCNQDKMTFEDVGMWD